MVDHNTLLHSKTVLIDSTSNFKNVTLEFVTKSITINFLGDSLIVEDAAI